MENRSTLAYMPGAWDCGAALLLSTCLLFSHFSFGQMPVDSLHIRYQLVKEEDNVIQNASALDEVFESLFQQLMLNDRIINIVHIGDSHIQADYLTATVRRHIQKQFGNAGRGLVVPYAVAGTNGPFNIVSRSAIKWNVKRCVSADNPLPVGIGGITIQTDNDSADLELHMNDLWMDYTFNTVSLFFLKDRHSFDFLISDTVGTALATIDGSAEEVFRSHLRIVLPRPVASIRLQAIQNRKEQDHATIFGLNLENGNNGILYHAIGVNGAKYEHYNAASLFFTQTAALEPKLFIISLGTNEAVSYPYLDRIFSARIEEFVSALRTINPQAKFLLITPPGAFRQKNRNNPGVAAIRKHLVDYAVENGLAFYDMYKAGGGDKSAEAWRDSALLRSDGIHFTKEGYEYQGNLFFHALMKAYNTYVLLRHP